ncbi:MAG: hypothetical protein V4787_06255 [Pseudomonadota bacterium]
MLPLALSVCTTVANAAVPSILAPEPIRFSFQVMEGGGAGGSNGDAFMDIGSVSAVGGRAKNRGIVVTRRIAVKLEGVASTAKVSVALLAEMPGCVIRLDGVQLTSIPRLIDPAHRVGSTVMHQLEMSIPAGVPAGPFLGNLQWLADTD